MKHTPSAILLLAGVSNALPMPQLPGFSLPFNLPMPTGLPEGGLGGGLGSRLPFSLPSLPTGFPKFPGSGSGGYAGGKLPFELPGLPTGLPGGGLSPGSGLSPPSLPVPTGGDGSGLSATDSLPSVPTPTGYAGSGASFEERGIDFPSGHGSGFNLPMPTGGSGSPLDGLRSKFSKLPKPTGAPGAGFGGLWSKLSLPSIPKPTGMPGFSLPGNGQGTSPPYLPISTGVFSGQSAPVAGDYSGESKGSATTPVEVTQPASTGNGSACGPPAVGGGATENGVKDGNCCTDVTVIFARGTGEPGNMGIISGPPMVKALREKMGAEKITVQGVDYPADAMGNANMGASGGKTMASLVQIAKSKCPSTKIVLSGYSQGAMVVHNALQQGVAGADIAGAVVFGDPLANMPITSTKVKSFCASGDFLCGGGNDLQGTHLSYGNVAGQAADFIAGVVSA